MRRAFTYRRIVRKAQKDYYREHPQLKAECAERGFQKGAVWKIWDKTWVVVEDTPVQQQYIRDFDKPTRADEIGIAPIGSNSVHIEQKKSVAKLGLYLGYRPEALVYQEALRKLPQIVKHWECQLDIPQQILRTLQQRGPEPIALSDLSSRTGIKSASLAHHLGKLVRDGLVERSKFGCAYQQG